MSAAVAKKTSLRDRAAVAVAAICLALSLMTGVAATASQVGAAQPQGGPVIVQPDDAGTIAERQKGKQATKQPVKQPEVYCVHLTALEWELIFGEVSETGGWSCNFR